MDDGGAARSLVNLKKFFDSLKKHCPAFGCHITTTHIITKEHLFEKATQIFVQEEVEIADDCRVLGSEIGSHDKEKNFAERSLKQQKSLLKKLAVHASVSP